nr:YcaO-like family protein [Mycobacterium gordonae]
MTSPVLRWRSHDDSNVLTSAPVVEASLNDLLDSGASSGPPLVSFHPLFASELYHLHHVPHPYIHLAIATARDGTIGEGSSTEPHRALTTSVFEVMERTFGTRYDPNVLSYAPHSALGDAAAVDPTDLVLLTDFEYRTSSETFVRYHPDLPLHWHPGLEIVGETVSPRLLPATLAVLRFSWTHTDERFAPSLSPGLASGSDLTDALLHGVYELIERDAFAMAWLQRRVGKRLDVAALPDPALDVSRARLSQDGYSLTFVELTNDVEVPAVMALISRSDTMHLAIGLGANVSIAHAAARAYAEALENMTNFYDFTNPVEARVREIVVPDRDFEPARYRAQCEFLLGTSRHRAAVTSADSDRVDARDALRRCLDALRRFGSRVFFVDLTPPGLHGQPYRLVRVLATGLQPHLYEWDSWRLANRRLPDDVEKLNLAPNPFAVLEHAQID